MKAKRFLSIFIAVLMLVSCFAISASADETYTLNIHLYETKNGGDIELDGNSHTTAQTAPTDKIAIPNVTFKIYKVADDSTSTTPSGDPVGTKITDENGLATFTNTTKGRYLVVVDDTKIPEYGSANGTTYVIPFLVDLPRTNAEGTANENTVDVYPKMLVTGAFVYQKTFNGKTPSEYDATNAPVAGFELYKITGEGADATETKVDITDNGCLTTATYNGLIYVNGLEFGTYKLKETTVPNDFTKAADTTITIEKGGFVTIGDNNTVTTVGTVVGYDNNTVATINNVPDTEVSVEKKVAEGEVDKDGAFSKYANIEEKATWKIDLTVPTDISSYKYFKITDSVDSRLTVDKTSVEVYNNNTKITSGYTADWSGNDLAVKFTDEGIAALTTGTVTVLFKTNNISEFGAKIPNNVTVSYVNTNGSVVDDDGDGEPDNPTVKDIPENDRPFVWSGKIDYTKVIKGSETTTLSGATFKLYDNAECTGDAIREVTTENDGKITFTNLKDGTYYLKETVAPKGYVLPENPVTITVGDGKQGSDAAKDFTKSVVEGTISNIPKTDLPLTGGMGTALFSLLGAAFVAFGGVMFVKSRKAKASL